MRSNIVAFQFSLFSVLISANLSDDLSIILTLDEFSAPSSRNHSLKIQGAEARAGNPFELRKRQFCPLDFYSCSTIAAPGVCCSTDSICSLDNVGNAACCPLGSFCTGTIAVPGNSPVTATSGGVVVIITSTNLVAATTATATATAAITAAVTTATYVPNSYYAFFPFIATSYSNSAACAAAYSGCTANYAACTASLQGGVGAGFGVTVSAPNGAGITLAPSVRESLPAQSAASVCSSLSTVACPGSGATCAVYGNAGQAGTTVVGVGEAVGGSGSLSFALYLGLVLGMIVGILGFVL